MAVGKIILSNNQRYFYKIGHKEIVNPLGVVVATLKAYDVSIDEAENAPILCSLYKTKEGNWYDETGSDIATVKLILPYLKSAIDTIEKKQAAVVDFE